MPGITGVPAGSTVFFKAGLVPPYSSPLQAGPKYSTTDNKVRLTPDPQNAFLVVVTVASDNPLSSFKLMIKGKTTQGEVNNSFVIPILRP